MTDQIQIPDRLSFSKLRAFAQSPKTFIEYLKGIPPTDDMVIGQAVHCLVLEPEEFDNRYIVIEQTDLPNPDKDFRDKKNREHRDVKRAEAEETGKLLIMPQMWEKIITRVNNLLRWEEFNIVQESDKEITVNGQIEEVSFTGVIDAIGNDYLCDIKVVNKIDPLRIRWKVMDGLYHWQAAIYNLLHHNHHGGDFYFIFVDDIGVLKVKITQSTLDIAYKEVTRIVQSWKHCRDNNLWHLGYSYHYPQIEV